jgi:hypothetical protein
MAAITIVWKMEWNARRILGFQYRAEICPHSLVATAWGRYLEAAGQRFGLDSARKRLSPQGAPRAVRQPT